MDHLSILIPDGDRHHSLRVINCLSRVPGIRLHVMAQEKCHEARFSRFCSSFRYCRHEENEQIWLREIAHTVKQDDIQVILPVSLEGVCFASRHQQELSDLAALTPTPPIQTLTATIDKWLFANLLLKHGIQHPETILVTLDDAFEAQLSCLTFPVLIKPRFGGGGMGIQAFHDRETLISFLKSHPEIANHYILQPFVPGQDFGCGVLSSKGQILAYTVQTNVETAKGFAPMTQCKFIHDLPILAATTQLMAALEWDGIAQIDFRYNEMTQQLEVIEINPRYWGSLIGSLIAGVNFPHLACQAALGQNFPMPEYIETEYVGGTEAVRRLFQAFLSGKRPSLSVKQSGLQFLLSNPTPYLVKLSNEHGHVLDPWIERLDYLSKSMTAKPSSHNVKQREKFRRQVESTSPENDCKASVENCLQA